MKSTPLAINILIALTMHFSIVAFTVLIFKPAMYDLPSTQERITLQERLDHINTEQSKKGLTDFVTVNGNILDVSIQTEEVFFFTLDELPVANDYIERYCKLLIILNESYMVNSVSLTFVSRLNSKIKLNTTLAQCKAP